MAPLLRLTVLLVACACAGAQQYEEERPSRYIPSQRVETTPVPILKQINRHNDDGSYTYGYEAADGSFKIETKEATGEVKGKYGYKDDSGKLRVVEYGANKYGFQPAGDGITVAPPTLVDESTNDEGLRPNKQQGGRYRQQQQDFDYEDAPAPRPKQYRPQPAPQPQYRPQPAPQQQYRPAPAPQQQYRPAPQAAPAPVPPKPQFFSGAAPAPAPVNQDFFAPEPAPAPRPKQQQFRPAPQLDQFPSFNTAPASPRYTSANFPEQRSQQPQQQPFHNQQPFSMLDALLKEYALPKSNAVPLHDISFGSY